MYIYIYAWLGRLSMSTSLVHLRLTEMNHYSDIYQIIIMQGMGENSGTCDYVISIECVNVMVEVVATVY